MPIGYGPLNTPATAGSSCKSVLPASVSNLNKRRTLGEFSKLRFNKTPEVTVKVIKPPSVIANEAYVQFPPSSGLNIGLTLQEEP